MNENLKVMLFFPLKAFLFSLTKMPSLIQSNVIHEQMCVSFSCGVLFLLSLVAIGTV